MCGFVGVMSRNKTMLSKNMITSMTDSIRHRGPDDSGLYTMSRYDGSIFNGDCTLKWHPSPISHGHLIRHPTGILPRSQDHHGLPKILGKANVMSCPFNFPVLESAAINKKGGFF